MFKNSSVTRLDADEVEALGSMVDLPVPSRNVRVEMLVGEDPQRPRGFRTHVTIQPEAEATGVLPPAIDISSNQIPKIVVGLLISIGALVAGEWKEMFRQS